MLKDDLREFMEASISGKYISAEDVTRLRHDILGQGLSSRAEAEALLSLDRTVETDESWGPAITSLIVNFMVGRSKPAGNVTSDDALWLVTALDVGGPTETAMNIAYAILDAARDIDGAILDFIMRGRQRARLQSIAA